MVRSPLSQFDSDIVSKLIGMGMDMHYVPRRDLRSGNDKIDGLFVFYDRCILIYEQLVNRGWYEDVVICHEWLHAMEFFCVEREFTERQIDWWAHYHTRYQPWLISSIRDYFGDEGF